MAVNVIAINATPQPPPLVPAPLARYTLDGTLADSGPNTEATLGYLGAAADHYTQGPTPTKRAWRAFVTAYGDGLQLSAVNSDWAQLVAAMSVVCRVRSIVDPRANPEATNRVIVECGAADSAGGANNSAWRIMLGYADVVIVEWYSGAGPTQRVYTTGQHLKVDHDTVLAVTRSAGGVVKVYRDGALIGTSGALTLPDGVTNARFAVGGTFHGGYNYADADISDVAVYGSELSATQIDAISRVMLGEHAYRVSA